VPGAVTIVVPSVGTKARGDAGHDTLTHADLILVADAAAVRWLEGAVRAGAAGTAPVLVAADDVRSATRVHRFGSRAGGVLPADATVAQLHAAIEAVRAGLRVSAPALDDDPSMDAGVSGIADGLDAEPLTPREQEVLELLALGVRNRTIAERLGISEHTARFHVASILGKLGVATRTQAVREGLRLGLVSM
jgi:DNA-binding NarL/FixJ family response regulator